MSGAATIRAGSAMRWRAIQLAGVQGVYFLRLIVLAQLLAPDAFGLVAIGIVAIGAVLRVSDLGTVPALVQRPAPTLDEFDGAWTVGLVRAAAVAAVLFAFAGPIAALFGEPNAAPIIRALGLRPLIEAAGSIGVARLTRDMSFQRLAMIAVPAAVTDFVVAVATAPWLSVWALVAGALAGSIATLILSYVAAPHRVRLMFRFAAIAPLIRYGRWVLATGIVALLGNLLTQLGVSRLEGAAALGLYFLATRVAFLPIDAMTAVIASVALPLFAKLRDDAVSTVATFRTLLTGQAVVLLPGYALVFVLAPALEAALGERWTGTAGVIRILAVSAVTGLLGEIVTPLLMGRGRADRVFRLEVVQTVVQVAVLWPLVGAFGVRGAALAWLAGNVAAMLVTIAWLRSLVPGGLALQPQPLLATLAAAGAAAAAGVAGAAAVPGLVGLLLGAVLGVAAAVVVLVGLDRWLSLHLWELARWVRGTRADSQAP